MSPCVGSRQNGAMFRITFSIRMLFVGLTLTALAVCIFCRSKWMYTNEFYYDTRRNRIGVFESCCYVYRVHRFLPNEQLILAAIFRIDDPSRLNAGLQVEDYGRICYLFAYHMDCAPTEDLNDFTFLKKDITLERYYGDTFEFKETENMCGIGLSQSNMQWLGTKVSLRGLRSFLSDPLVSEWSIEQLRKFLAAEGSDDHS